MSDDLAKAAFDGDVEAVARLLDDGADIDAESRNSNPLHAAIENERVACVELLIRRGADVERSVSGYVSPLAHAVDIAIDGTIQIGGKPGGEPTEVIKILLNAGADPRPGLLVAQKYGAAKIIDLLSATVEDRLNSD